MAMNFEIEIVSRSYIGLNLIFDFLKENNIADSIEYINSIDSWAWENITEIIDLTEVPDRLKEGKIIVSDISMINGNELGMYIDFSNNLIHYSFWFNVNQSDKTQENQLLYNHIYNLIEESIDQLKYELIIGAIGFEMLFKFFDDIEQTITRSSGIEAFFLSTSVDKQVSIATEHAVKFFPHMCVLELRKKMVGF